MTIEEAVLEKLRALSALDQQRVLQFVQSLSPASAARRDPKGLFAHRGVQITLEEMEEARREAWASFPRDLPAGAEP